MRILLVALLASLAWCAPAQGATGGAVAGLSRGLPLILPGPRDAQVVADPASSFRIALGKRARGVYAYADPSTNTVHVRRGGRRDRFAVAHELGHLLDYQALTDADRARFTRMLLAPAGSWDGDDHTGPLGSPAEWFADYYAAAAVHLKPFKRMPNGTIVQQSVSSYADIGQRRLDKFGRAMDEIARERGLAPLKLR